MLDLLAKSADPDLALTGVDRLSERVPDLLARLTAAPVLARQLIMVLGGSNKLSHHLIAHPEHLELLETELVKVPAASLRRELLEATGADPESPTPIATDSTGNQLRIAYRGALLRIAARDLCAPEPIEVVDDIADELSDLADATLEAALSIARLKLGENALQTRLAVIGLGKCGAQELNYVSDVDVLFVAEPVVDSDGHAAGQQRPGCPDRHPDGGRDDPDLLGAHLGRDDLGSGCRPQAGGQGRSASAHAVQPSHLLREVGQDLGIPGDAQGAPSCR